MTDTTPAEKHIFVVDDSVEYLNFMQLLLTAEGFRADTACTTDALRDLLRAGRPDLVISDVRMPGHEAFAVLELLNGEDGWRGIPVLLCTGALQEVQAQAQRLKRDGLDVLFKPFDIDDLIARVHRLCGVDQAHIQ